MVENLLHIGGKKVVQEESLTVHRSLILLSYCFRKRNFTTNQKLCFEKNFQEKIHGLKYQRLPKHQNFKRQELEKSFYITRRKGVWQKNINGFSPKSDSQKQDYFIQEQH